jgi:signal peptidase I
MARRRLFDFRSVPREQRALILACILFWSVISYLIVAHFVLQTTVIIGHSMAPTLEDGDRFIINRWIYRWRDPQRDEIVEVQVPGDDDPSVKRIVALPGERIHLKRGRVFINGRLRREWYLSPGTWTFPEALSTNIYAVEPNCYFVLGDNRQVSVDSRVFGAVRREWIMGRITPEKR